MIEHFAADWLRHKIHSTAAVLLAGDAALIVRAFYEEQTLSQDPKYVRYCKSVKWRLVPGVC